MSGSKELRLQLEENIEMDGWPDRWHQLVLDKAEGMGITGRRHARFRRFIRDKLAEIVLRNATYATDDLALSATETLCTDRISFNLCDVCADLAFVAYEFIIQDCPDGHESPPVGERQMSE